MTLTVKDLIKHLQTLPEDTEWWRCWDESCECWPVTILPDNMITKIYFEEKRKRYTCTGYEDEEYKSVLLLN